MDYILQANGLCKEYRHAKALDGLSLRVPKGSIYGLVGKNGAGKTTLIRILCGLQQPTAGSFSLYGAGWGEPGFARARRTSRCRTGCWACRTMKTSPPCCG